MDQRLTTGKSRRTAAPPAFVGKERNRENFRTSARMRLMTPKAPTRESFMMRRAVVRGVAPAQAVGGVGQAVQVQPAGDPHRQRQEQGRGRRGRQDFL